MHYRKTAFDRSCGLDIICLGVTLTQVIHEEGECYLNVFQSYQSLSFLHEHESKRLFSLTTYLGGSACALPVRLFELRGDITLIDEQDKDYIVT